MKKVLVIGVDGLSLELINRWKEELPNLKQIMERGIYGELQSTFPPMTSPAWNSMFSGKNPAKFGIFDWLAFPFDKERGFRIVNYCDQDSPSLWDILGGCGIKVGVVNVPTTFPPRRVNGFMVSGGLLTPLYKDVNYTFPMELKEELNKALGGYEILPLTDLNIPGKEQEYLQLFKRNIRKHVEAAKYLMLNKEWDFFTQVFFVTDSVQHYCWHHMDDTHPKHDSNQAKKYGSAIKNIYKEVDKAIGELIAKVPENTVVMIVSDHGFGSFYGYFLVNEWLREKGFLKLKRQESKLNISKIMNSIKNIAFKYFNSRLVEFFIRLFPKKFLEKFLVREQLKSRSANLIQAIDWTKTKAYGLGGVGSIFINLKGREPEGVVEASEYENVRGEIIRALYELKHPVTGVKVVDRVFKKEELYKGKYLQFAPDLMYIMDGLKYVQSTAIGNNKIWIDSQLTGGHRMEGVFMAYGRDIESGKQLNGIQIYDVTPTILHIFGIPIPKDMDGRVLTEVFEEDSELARRPVVYQEVDEHERVKKEIKKLKKRGRV